MIQTQRSAGGLAALVAGTLALHIWLDLQDGMSVAGSIWDMLRYFTYWTNALVGATLLWVASGRSIPASALSCLLMSMALVSSVYYLVLYKPDRYEGLDVLVDWMLHTVIPFGLLGFWLRFVDKSKLAFRQTLFWQFYPVFYCIYVLIRGQLDGTYPYGFLRPPEIGWDLVIRNIAVLSVVFIITGLGIVSIGGALSRKQPFNN